MWLAVFMLSCAAPERRPREPQQPLFTPAEVYGDLYVAVQLGGIYADGKTFADAIPMTKPAAVLAAYSAERKRPGFDLRAFLRAHFSMEVAPKELYRAVPGASAGEHVDQLWPVLTRPADSPNSYSSKIALPHRYVVPGGRFRELYYWDSYFTMLGLLESGRGDLVEDMVKNFAWLIDRFGHVPNGSRSYYVSRSQPPFFALMVELLAQRDGPAAYVRYRSQLRREYDFWMEGAAALAPNQAHRRVVRLSDGSLLNRYWDDMATPRDESYLEDVETARASDRPAHVVFRELRAAAESGWDFSSRWLADGKTLATIRTTELVPVDLNSLLYRLELVLALACEHSGDSRCARELNARAVERQRSLDKHLWNEELGGFADHDLRAGRVSGVLSAATLYPLFVGACRPEQAHRVAETTRARLLRAHGVVTTEVESGQQWDAPNGWAPLQWIAIQGLAAYGEQATADDIARRWMAVNLALFQREGRFVEKYDVESAVAGEGGEYPTQDGFGWTNGVLRKLLTLYPQSTSGSAARSDASTLH